MEKRILIPTDFSDNALNAVRYALDLYTESNCEFYFLNVFRVAGYTTNSLLIPEPGSAPYEAAKAESEEGLLKLRSFLKSNHENSKHSYHLISTLNFLSEAIKQTIAQKDIDLVVMGNQGASGAKGIIFGSNTVNTMEKITACPVLAIPKDVQFSDLKEIVFPTNFKATFKRNQLHYLIEIAQMNEAAVRVLHVTKKTELTENQEANKQLLDDILGPVDHSFHNLSTKDVNKGIVSFAESRDSDMIAFVNRKHLFFGNMLTRPLVKEIGYDATLPILALRQS